MYLVLILYAFLQEERRRQAAEAAERRQREAEGRGLKDPDGYKRKIEQREQIERDAAKAGGGADGPLKVILATVSLFGPTHINCQDGEAEGK